MEDFKERIIPTFARAESQKKQIQGLLDDMRKLRKETETLKVIAKEFETLQHQHVSLRDELHVHVSGFTHWKKTAGELDIDNKRYKDLLERHKNTVR